MIEEEQESEAKDLKRAWWWKYYNVVVLDTTWERGRGTKRATVKDEEYKCRFYSKCRFKKLASVLKCSTSAMSSHIEKKHNIHENTASENAISRQATTMDIWAKPGVKALLDFDEALLDWIIYTNQAFTCVESPYMRTLIQATGRMTKLPSADTIASRIKTRVASGINETTKLIEETATTIAVTLDGWKSQNRLAFIGINATWCSSDFEVYRACLDFVQITESHSGENMAVYVFKALKRHNCLTKLLTITADNASNNDTLCRHLHRQMTPLYDEWLSEHRIRKERMRFMGEESQIRCFAHILNLVVQKILTTIGSSSHKNAADLLDRVAASRNKTITPPLASGVIALLRLQVLWVQRSAQRRHEWRSRPNVNKYIATDVDNRWNYTLRMIENAEENKAGLDDTVSDHPELEHLRLKKEHWITLSNIKKVLKPFERYTQQVSKKAPSLHMSVKMYCQLQTFLKKVVNRDGEFSGFDNELVRGCDAGLELFNEYFDYMQQNDIYLIASVLDPRVKTRWIRKNFNDADEIITRIRKFLKDTYQKEAVPTQKKDQSKHKTLEYEFLQEFEESDGEELQDNDIDQYFDTAPIKFVLNEDDDQALLTKQWWSGNSYVFPLMARAARDYLPIPASEADIERLFSNGRDILGVRRWALQGQTMQALTLCKEELRRKERGDVVRGPENPFNPNC